MDQVKAARAAVEEPPATPLHSDVDEIVAFLRTVGSAARAGLRACESGRSGLDRLILLDPAFRTIGG
jgi:hypothetical protein